MNLYPNSHFENTNTIQASVYQYASPVLPTNGPINDEFTNAQIRDGKMYVNNGF
jgi:hypothetical protein